MTCQEFDERAEAGFDELLRHGRVDLSPTSLEGTLPDGLREHLGECGKCRRRLRSTIWLHATVQSLPKPIPERKLADAVVAELKRDRSKQKMSAPLIAKPIRQTGRLPVLRLVVALATCVCLAIFVSRRSANQPVVEAPALAANSMPADGNPEVAPTLTPEITPKSSTPHSPLSTPRSKRPGFSPLLHGLEMMVRSRPVETETLKEASKTLLPSGFSQISFEKKIAAKAVEIASATRSVGAGVKPVTDSAGRAFSFLWQDLAMTAPNPN